MKNLLEHWQQSETKNKQHNSRQSVNALKFRGKYKVYIKQAVRETGKVPGVEQLEGITDVGFRIENKE